MAKFEFLGLVSLDLGLNWTKRKLVASWAVVRNLKIVGLVISLGLFNLAALYFFSQNTAIVENHKRDSGDGEYQNIRLLHEALDIPAVAQTRRLDPCISLDSHHHNSSNSSLPLIYIITPTYQRWTQKADLTRLCYTLMHVPNLHWIVVEDSEQKTGLVYRLLSGRYSCKMRRTTHLNVKTPGTISTMMPVQKTSLRAQSSFPHRGVLQRNIALMWLREVAKLSQLEFGGSGVVYFGDDDNVYDLRVFEEMRSTQRVSVWPVGLSAGLKYEGPICEDGRVVDWYAMWGRERTFMIDMAGFAINLQLLLNKPEASFDLLALKGRLEESILVPLTTQEELEPKADNCKSILVWHVRTAKPAMTHEETLIKKGRASDPDIEV